VRTLIHAGCLACAVLTTACGSPALPAIGKPVSSLDDVDTDVMRAVLDRLRFERDESIRRGRPLGSEPAVINAVLLLFDRTVAVCVNEPSALFPSPFPDCLDHWWLERIRTLTDDFDRSASASLRRRNALPLPIRADLGPDVAYIPAQVDNVERLGEFRRRYPSGSAVVRLSAPVYPSAGSAIVAYRMFWHGGGFMRLARSNGEWFVLRTSDWLE
jgi:hypothetical protein